MSVQGCLANLLSTTNHTIIVNGFGRYVICFWLSSFAHLLAFSDFVQLSDSLYQKFFTFLDSHVTKLPIMEIFLILFTIINNGHLILLINCTYVSKTCTEMVMPIGYGPNETMFQSRPFDLNNFTATCQDLFGITPRPHWITTEFGGHVSSKKLTLMSQLKAKRLYYETTYLNVCNIVTEYQFSTWEVRKQHNLFQWPERPIQCWRVITFALLQLLFDLRIIPVYVRRIKFIQYVFGYNYRVLKNISSTIVAVYTEKGMCRHLYIYVYLYLHWPSL